MQRELIVINRKKAEYRFLLFNRKNRAYDDLYSMITVVPIDEEIIRLAVDYKSEIENLDVLAKKELLNKSLNKFIKGQKSTFALFILNKGNLENKTKFNDFRNNTIIKDDVGNEFNLISYTPFLDYDLPMNSLEKGFIHFENIRNNSNTSYSVIFNNYSIYSGYYSESSNHNFTISFESNDLQLLSLIENGIDRKEIINIASSSKSSS